MGIIPKQIGVINVHIVDSVLNYDSTGKKQHLHRSNQKKLTHISKNVVRNHE